MRSHSTVWRKLTSELHKPDTPCKVVSGRKVKRKSRAGQPVAMLTSKAAEK